MKVFIDLEFTGLHQHTTIISIGMISEHGHMFYGEFDHYNKTQVDEWIQANVIVNLGFPDIDGVTFRRGTNYQMTKSIENWLSMIGCHYHNKAEFWGDCIAWDWVLFCELFGGGLHLPDHINYIPRDIATLFDIKGIDPDINREEFSEINDTYWVDMGITKHNALWDAKAIKLCYDKLIKL